MIAEGDRFPVEALPRPLGGPVVVYFYPADFTGTCESEARNFEGLYDDFRAAGVEVVGVSVDTSDSHERFAKECGLRFPLVSDEGGALTERLGLMKDYGEFGNLAARVTLLLDRKGQVRRIWPAVEVGGHAEEALAAARELANPD